MDKSILFNKCNPIYVVYILKCENVEILKCNHTIQFSKPNFDAQEKPLRAFRISSILLNFVANFEISR